MKKLTLFMLAVMLMLCARGPAGAYASEEVSEPAEEIVCVLDTCDTAFNAISCTISDTTAYVEGTGCWYVKNEASRIEAIFYDLDRSALPAFEEAYLEFYYWIADIKNFSSGAIELNSCGWEDYAEIEYGIGRYTAGLSEGWNFVSIKLTDMREASPNPFVYSDLVGMRIYALPALYGTSECRVDYITLSNRSHSAEVAERGITVAGTAVKSPDYKVSEKVYSAAKKRSALPVAFLSVGCALFAGGAAFGAVFLIKAKRGRKKDD